MMVRPRPPTGRRASVGNVKGGTRRPKRHSDSSNTSIATDTTAESSSMATFGNAAEEKQQKEKKRVRFTGRTRAIRIPHISTFSLKMKRSVWWSRKELQIMRDARDIKVISLRREVDYDKDGNDCDTCTLGLNTCDSELQRLDTIDEIVLAVFLEQQRQWEEEVEEPYKLARKSIEGSARCRQDGLDRARKLAESLRDPDDLLQLKWFKSRVSNHRVVRLRSCMSPSPSRTNNSKVIEIDQRVGRSVATESNAVEEARTQCSMSPGRKVRKLPKQTVQMANSVKSEPLDDVGSPVPSPSRGSSLKKRASIRSPLPNSGMSKESIRLTEKVDLTLLSARDNRYFAPLSPRTASKTLVPTPADSKKFGRHAALLVG